MAKYTESLGDKICELTATSSVGLRHICKQLEIPYSTVTDWIYDRDHELHDMYALAKVRQLQHLADEILEIADDTSNDYMTVEKNGKMVQVPNHVAIARARIRINARMALISKLAPAMQKANAAIAAKPAKDEEPEEDTFEVNIVNKDGSPWEPTEEERKQLAEIALQPNGGGSTTASSYFAERFGKKPFLSSKSTSKPAQGKHSFKPGKKEEEVHVINIL